MGFSSFFPCCQIDWTIRMAESLSLLLAERQPSSEKRSTNSFFFFSFFFSFFFVSFFPLPARNSPVERKTKFSFSLVRRIVAIACHGRFANSASIIVLPARQSVGRYLCRVFSIVAIAVCLLFARQESN